MHIPWTIGNGRQSSFSLGVYVKGIVRVIKWHKWMDVYLHLMQGLKYQFWYLNIFLEETLYNIPRKIGNGRQSTFSIGV